MLLEAANFEPVSLLRTSERLALRTEGSNRWEKGVDPYLAGHAATMATRLIVELAGARWTGAADEQANMPTPAVLTLRPERTSALLGLDVAAERQSEILGSLGFERADGGYRVPTWRARDVTREVDLIEEVARFVLDEIPFTLPEHAVTFGRLTRWQRVRRLVEDVLAGCGFSEAYTSTFVANGDLRLPQPISQEAAALRTLARGEPRRGGARERRGRRHRGRALRDRAHVPRGRASSRTSAGTSPASSTAASRPPSGRSSSSTRRSRSSRQWNARLSLCCIRARPRGRARAGSGELHPSVLDGVWGAFELDLDALVERAPEVVAFEEVSPYPEVRQDLAFVVDAGVPAAELLAAMREAGAPELRSVSVFDEYRGEQIGEGKKSLAFRTAYGSPERTLTDEEAAAVRGRIVEALGKRFGAELRA